MRVIKLGGSLVKDQSIASCLQKVADKYPTGAVVVPGGGLFADLVRQSQEQWGFNDIIAHHMAILAMQQMALLFSGLAQKFVIAQSINDIKKHLDQGQNVIWSPAIESLNNAHIAASWSITSDSLAAWLAQQLKAEELIVIKAVHFRHDIDFEEMAKQNIVDKAFNNYIKNAEFKTSIINKNDF